MDRPIEPPPAKSELCILTFDTLIVTARSTAPLSATSRAKNTSLRDSSATGAKVRFPRAIDLSTFGAAAVFKVSIVMRKTSSRTGLAHPFAQSPFLTEIVLLLARRLIKTERRGGGGGPP